MIICKKSSKMDALPLKGLVNGLSFEMSLAESSSVLSTLD